MKFNSKKKTLSLHITLRTKQKRVKWYAHTDLSRITVGEKIHEQMDSPQSKALIIRR